MRKAHRRHNTTASKDHAAETHALNETDGYPAHSASIRNTSFGLPVIPKDVASLFARITRATRPKTGSKTLFA